MSLEANLQMECQSNLGDRFYTRAGDLRVARAIG
jgi:hypothetical protein